MTSVPIRCSGLACGYGKQVVLRGVILELGAGTTTALLGPNGSGKTTLLKTLVREIPLLEGSVEVLGASLPSLKEPELARKIGYVPQQETPRFGFTIREVVAMGRLAHSEGLFESETDWQKVEEAMARADCAPFADRLMAEVSGGERQRALIARALAQEAPILLLDEPTAHLDPAHHLALGKLIRTLASEGATIVMAIHDLNLASSYSDRAILLHDGEVRLIGDTQDVLHNAELDAVYGVQFERIERPGRPLRVEAFED